jgi:hypothetical protein
MQLIEVINDFTKIQTAIDADKYTDTPFALARKYAKINSLGYPMMKMQDLAKVTHKIKVENDINWENNSNKYEISEQGKTRNIHVWDMLRKVEPIRENYYESNMNPDAASYILPGSERYLAFYNGRLARTPAMEMTFNAQRWYLKLTDVKKYKKIPPPFVAEAATKAADKFDKMFVVEPDKQEYTHDGFSLIDDPLLIGVLNESPDTFFLISGWLEDFSIEDFHKQSTQLKELYS